MFVDCNNDQREVLGTSSTMEGQDDGLAGDEFSAEYCCTLISSTLNRSIDRQSVASKMVGESRQSMNTAIFAMGAPLNLQACVIVLKHNAS